MSKFFMACKKAWWKKVKASGGYRGFGNGVLCARAIPNPDAMELGKGEIDL